MVFTLYLKRSWLSSFFFCVFFLFFGFFLLPEGLGNGHDNEFQFICCSTDQKEDSNQANCSPAMHLVDNDITRGHGAKMVEYKKRNRSPSRLKKTESSLKLEITQLCDILKLPVCSFTYFGVL